MKTVNTDKCSGIIGPQYINECVNHNEVSIETTISTIGIKNYDQVFLIIPHDKYIVKENVNTIISAMNKMYVSFGFKDIRHIYQYILLSKFVLVI